MTSMFRGQDEVAALEAVCASLRSRVVLSGREIRDASVGVPSRRATRGLRGCPPRSSSCCSRSIVLIVSAGFVVSSCSRPVESSTTTPARAHWRSLGRWLRPRPSYKRSAQPTRRRSSTRSRRTSGAAPGRPSSSSPTGRASATPTPIRSSSARPCRTTPGRTPRPSSPARPSWACSQDRWVARCGPRCRSVTPSAGSSAWSRSGCWRRTSRPSCAHISAAILIPPLLGLALGLGGALLLARRVKRQTFGLEPGEIAALLEQREAMLHGVREGTVTVNVAGRITLINDEAQRLLGLDASAMGQELSELVPTGRVREVLAGQVAAMDEVIVVADRVLVVNRMPVEVRGRLDRCGHHPARPHRTGDAAARAGRRAGPRRRAAIPGARVH